MGITVHVEIVGLFLKEPVSVASNTATIKDVLDQLVIDTSNQTANNSKHFHYHAPRNKSGKIMIDSFQVEHPTPFKSDRTGTSYPSGVYKLSNTTHGHSFSVWQYYVLGSDGKDRPVAGPLSFADFRLNDGDHIIWRSVNIHAPQVYKLPAATPAKDSKALTEATAAM